MIVFTNFGLIATLASIAGLVIVIGLAVYKLFGDKDDHNNPGV